MKIGFLTHKDHLEIDTHIIGYKKLGKVHIYWYNILLGLMLIKYTFGNHGQIIFFNLRIMI